MDKITAKEMHIFIQHQEGVRPVRLFNRVGKNKICLKAFAPVKLKSSTMLRKYLKP
jgi:hypothetical protein